ncbi:YfcE family phosphodiesterase [Anaerococcus sp. DFU013_CI05]|uniref:YfcE family phosphodiesterase n=1 Tax=Anaerococcus sp. AH8042_DFU013_CI05 TaxID=3385202 RepID=UPI003A5211F1
MKILVTSDTHGIYSAISDYILIHKDIDLLVHAGDGVEDVKNIAYETDINYEVVTGNNDYSSNEAFEKIIEVEDIKIFLTHGNQYGVYYGEDQVLDKAKELNCNIAIHGHTHKCLNITKDDITILNPGSVSMPRDNNPGFFILDIDAGVFEITRVSTNKEIK